jgi:glutathione synthase/RimK-type ligase-like ATP-grasp enzyme
MRILVLTDTSDYGPEATLYPLIRGLTRKASVDAVFVADRRLKGNRYFYQALDPQATMMFAHRADADYDFATRDSYASEIIHVDDVDAVWMRLDLASAPFLRYVSHRWAGRFISNKPGAILRTGTKAFLLALRPLMGTLMPDIALCQSVENVRAFQARYPDLVLKVLRSFGGKGVVRLRRDGESDLVTDDDIARFLHDNGSCLAMEYLDNPHQSDNRLIVSNGVILGTLARVPKPGHWLCNLMAGGSYDRAEADAREQDIVRRIDPVMRDMGIHFYGVDTLLNARNERVLSEVNTMNAGGAGRYEYATGKLVCNRIADDFVDNAFQFASHPARPARTRR